MRGLSPVVASRDHSSSRCAGLSLSRPLLLQSTSSRCAGPVVVAHGPSRSAACGILPDQGPNPCPLHWQADSQPLRHQGSPLDIFEGCVLVILRISLSDVSPWVNAGAVSPPYPQVLHPWIQPTMDQIYSKKSSKKFQKATLPHTSNYLHSIYIVLGIINDLEMI